MDAKVQLLRAIEEQDAAKAALDNAILREHSANQETRLLSEGMAVAALENCEPEEPLVIPLGKGLSLWCSKRRNGAVYTQIIEVREI